jgi:carbamoyl-phosphate synthase large subunit
MKTLRLLLTSAGRRVELLQCFRADAEAMGIDLEVLACDLKPEWSSACHLADRRFAVPRATDAGYVDAIFDICQAYDVGLVVPTIDPELLPLALARERFQASGAHIAVSAAPLIEMARDKLATADFLKANGIPSPLTMPAEAVLDKPDQWQWPLIVKARSGSASRGFRLVERPGDFPDPAATEPLVAQQRLIGVEYTVNLYFDSDGALRAAIPHERVAIRAGEVEKGVTRRVPQLIAIAREMAEVLPEPGGALCFQAIVDAQGAASVFEINARFGGGFPLAHHAGARFSRWLMEERLGLNSTAHDNWREGVAMMRYDAAVFVEP